MQPTVNLPVAGVFLFDTSLSMGYRQAGQTRLEAAQAEVWERALYGALRVQEEQATLTRYMAVDARRQGRMSQAEHFEKRTTSFEEGAELIRQLLARARP